MKNIDKENYDNTITDINQTNSIEQIHLFARSRKIISKLNVNTIDALCELTEADILNMYQSGPKTVEDINKALREIGKSLKPSRPKKSVRELKKIQKIKEADEFIEWRINFESDFRFNLKKNKKSAADFLAAELCKLLNDHLDNPADTSIVKKLDITKGYMDKVLDARMKNRLNLKPLELLMHQTNYVFTTIDIEKGRRWYKL